MSSTIPATHQLRPVERAVRRMTEEGLSTQEIALKLRKRPRSVQLIEWSANQRLEGGFGEPSRSDPKDDASSADSVLTPMERCILRHLEDGETHGMVGSRVNRSGAQVRRLEAYARFKLDGVWTAPPLTRPHVASGD